MFKKSFAIPLMKGIAKRIGITMLTFFLMCLPLMPKAAEKASLHTNRAHYPAKSIEYRVTLQKNGDAQVTERWDVDVQKSLGANVSSSVIDVNRMTVTLRHKFDDNDSRDLVDFRVSEDGVTLELNEEWKNDGMQGLYAMKQEDEYGRTCWVRWGISDYGRHIYEFSYTIKNLVGRCDDIVDNGFVLADGHENHPAGTAFSWMFYKLWWSDLKPNRLSLSMEMEGGGLNKLAYYTCADGFKGMAGFSGDIYRAESFGEFRDGDDVSLCMTFLDGAFDEPQEEFKGYFLRHTGNSDSQRIPRSWAFGRVIQASIWIAFALFVAFVVLMILYWVRINRQPEEDGVELNRADCLQIRRYTLYAILLLALIIVASTIGSLKYYITGFLLIMVSVLLPLSTLIFLLIDIRRMAGLRL